MKILVCLKAVPATAQVQVDGQFRLQRDGVSLEWNIADESALEAALQMKGSEDTVTVLTMGPKKLEEAMVSLMARGADRAVLVTDPKMAGADTYATAKALASAVEKLGGFDLILCGRRAIDGETGQVPGMLAAALGIPCVTNCERLEGGALYRRLEGGVQKLEVTLPVVASVCEYAYPLRLAGIMGMRRAKQKQVEILSAADLGLEDAVCGLGGSMTKVVSMSAKFPGLRKGPKETDLSIGAKKLLDMCREVGV